MSPSPDLAGFRAATERKRAAMGEEVLFLGEPVVTFPPGTPLDPETGKPFDPVIVPTASARASATATCEVAYRTIGRAGFQVESDALGWEGRTDVMLIAGSGTGSKIVGMTEFIVRGDTFEIRAKKFDGVTGIDRYLIWGAKK